jgi:hypothetical protein
VLSLYDCDLLVDKVRGLILGKYFEETNSSHCTWASRDKDEASVRVYRPVVSAFGLVSLIAFGQGSPIIGSLV